MKCKFFCFMACFALAFVCARAQAGVIGSFANVGTIADPFVAADVYDIFEFSIVSSEGDISTLDFTTATGGGFSTTGIFGQFSQTFSDGTAFPTGGPFTFPDTFFVVNPAPPTVSGLVVDDAMALEGFYSNGLTPLAVNGVSTVVAVLTVLQGSVSSGDLVSFAGGFADVEGQLVGITTTVIPEPNTLVLGGFAMVCIVLRSRRRL